MPVIAEGVEEAEQVEMLKRIGCRIIQGYFYSKPLPIPEYEEFCKKYENEDIQDIIEQKLMAEGDERAAKIYDSIGVYFGYAVAYYALFYDIKHVLLMGRVSSGEGGNILFQNAQKVLAVEFPELAEKITIHLPDESSRRVGQSIAAASLPNIK